MQRSAWLFYLVCVSSIASSLHNWQEGPFGETSHQPFALSLATVPASPATSPADGSNSALSEGVGGRQFLLRENTSRSLRAQRTKAIGRAECLSRTGLRPGGAERRCSLLWVHTCSVSLSERHVRLQI